MPSCVFRRCRNYTATLKERKDVTFHSFPLDDVRKEDWVAVVRKQRSEYDWMPSKSSKICSVHFKSEDKYSSEKGRTLLKKNAIPVIEEYECHNTHNIPASPSSLDNVSIPDMEEILESPRRAALRKRVNKLTFEKKLLQKKNKVLIKQNKRLKERVARMADMLKTLRKCNLMSKKNIQKLNMKSEDIDLNITQEKIQEVVPPKVSSP